MGRTLESVAAGCSAPTSTTASSAGGPNRSSTPSTSRLLGRKPDAGGRPTWLDALRRGTTRLRSPTPSTGSARVASPAGGPPLRRRSSAGRPTPAAGRSGSSGSPALGDVGLAARLAGSNELHRRATGARRSPTSGWSRWAAGTAYPLARSWRAGCPVGPGDLRAVTFPHHRPDGTTARGVLIVHRDVVHDVATLVRAAWGSRFPITQARPVDDFGGDDDASMAADNSSAFNCRVVAGTTTWSQHAYGRAVDLNPVRNPYVRGSHHRPAGRGRLHRPQRRPARHARRGRSGHRRRRPHRLGLGRALVLGLRTSSTCRRTDAEARPHSDTSLWDTRHTDTNGEV